MPRHFASKAHSLTIVTLFSALVVILFSSTSLAQVKTASHGPAAPVKTPLRKHPQAVSMDGGAPLFLPPVVYGTGGVDEAGFVTVVDVNGDGIPDLLVANSYYSDTIVEFIGKGDGSFSYATAFPSGGGFPMGIVAVDVNGDGLLDLVVINQTSCYACSGDGLVAVLLGNGNGSFGPPTTYDSGGVGPSSGDLGPNPIAVRDVNGDGKLDVVVANCAPSGSTGCGDGNGVVGVLLGNGDGTFRPVVTYDSGSSPGGTGLVMADLNHDGKVDVVVTNGCVYADNCSHGGIGVLLSNGDGTFRPAVNYALAGWSAGGIATADLNGDGNPDVIVGGCGSSNCWGVNGMVSVLLGNGDGTFAAASGYDAGGQLADGLALADFTGDGKLDVVVADTLNSSIAMLPGNGDGTFQLPLIFATGGSFSYSVAAADLNGDGKTDVVVTSLDNPATISVFLNSGVFTYNHTSTGLASSANPAGKKEMVTYTATVTAADGGSVTGMVRFEDGNSSSILEGIVNGQAAYTTSYNKIGDHAIVAAYAGDPTHTESSARLTEVIGKKPFKSATTLATSGSPSMLGQPVTFTATVTSIYGTIPDGEVVTFYDGGVSIGNGRTSSGVATFTTSSLTVGKHPIEAIYSGDSTFKTSDGKVKQVVKQ